MLTEKQKKYREWYQRNKSKVCAAKRQQYQAGKATAKQASAKANTNTKTNTKTKKATAGQEQANMELGHLYGPGHRPFNRYAAKPESVPSRRTQAECQRKLQSRRKREDVELARELGITVAELRS